MVRSIAIATGIAAGGLAYAHLETKLFGLHRLSVPVLPEGAPDIRILHLSDVHLLPTHHRKLEWLRSLARLRPNLVVTTGDNISSAGAIEPLLAALGSLLRLPGVFVFGSNDYWAPAVVNPARYLLHPSRPPEHLAPLPWPTLARALVESGWRDLNNLRDWVELPDGQVLTFVGTDDAHLDYDAFPGAEYHPQPTLEHAGLVFSADRGRVYAGSQAPTLHLGVTHAPYRRVLQAMLGDGVALALAGHTHGGQLRLPWFGALVTNCDLDRRAAAGLTRWPPGSGLDRGLLTGRPSVRALLPGSDGANRAMWLHVSGGAGTSPWAPVRFACRPSATLLTLTSASFANQDDDGVCFSTL